VSIPTTRPHLWRVKGDLASISGGGALGCCWIVACRRPHMSTQSKHVCHVDKEWFGVLLLTTVCDGYDSGSCLSGRILNVIRRVDMVLGHPREDALVDTCLREDRLWHQTERHSGGNPQANITASILHGAYNYIQPTKLAISYDDDSGVKSRSLFPPFRSPVKQTQQQTQASILAHLAASPCTTGT
jgi:hypothetical protein